jgi:hypothetical protein
MGLTVGVIDAYLQFYIPLKNCALMWRRHHWLWRAAKFWPMLGAQGLWAGCAVTPNLNISGLIRMTTQYNRPLQHTRGCGWFILILIITGTAGVTGRQRMLAPPKYPILLLHLLGSMLTYTQFCICFLYDNYVWHFVNFAILYLGDWWLFVIYATLFLQSIQYKHVLPRNYFVTG